MFGLVAANPAELTPQQKERYNSVYCGICRSIRDDASNLCRLGLRYDMAFLALLHMSLYEPEETSGDRACLLHPVKPRPWVTSGPILYAGEMNVALAYHNCLDDWKDDRNLGAKLLADVFAKHCGGIREAYPRQWNAIDSSINQLNDLEEKQTPDPDAGANCFGRLMGELMVWREDQWAPYLRQIGFYLGRFIYLADAALDYRRDVRKGKYNPIAASGAEDPEQWQEYLVMAMARCTQYYEQLPLVQDKEILDNILYSGVWVNYYGRRKENRREEHNG